MQHLIWNNRLPVLMALMLVLACAEGGEVSCPEGQIVVDGRCVEPPQDTSAPQDAQDTGGGIDTAAPLDTFDAQSDTATADTRDTRDSSPDTGPGGTIGSACTKHDDCPGSPLEESCDFIDDDQDSFTDEGCGVCLFSEGGYCTLLGCGHDGVACPDGSICLDVGMYACLKLCSGETDCRQEDNYACKSLLIEGSIVKVCRPSGDAPSGAACTSDQDCSGEAACLPQLKKGYCAELECTGAGDCPADSVCVDFEGMNACMKTCSDSSECREEHDHACVPLQAVAGGTTDVCSMKSGTVPIGGQCEVDLDCVSRSCDEISKGKCNNPSGTLCLANEDCPAYGLQPGICDPDPDAVFGACSQTCTLPFQPGACPDNAVCANFGALFRCIASCNDDEDCRAEIDFHCLPGGDLAQEVHGCVRDTGREVGSACEADQNCSFGYCKTDMPAGYCTAQCSYDPLQPGSKGCVFPGVCVQHEGTPLCARRCTNIADCRENYACKNVGPSPKVCWPTTY